MITELHRHLDASIRLSTLHELALEKGIEKKGTTLEALKEKIILSRPLKNLTEVLARFDIFQKVLDSKEVIEKISFQALEDCAREGTNQIEFRFSPSFLCEKNGLSWEEGLKSVVSGLKKASAQYPDMKWGLICIASRDYGEESVSQTVEFFLKYRSDFIGFDLAGNENRYPCRLFENAFKPLVLAQVPITIHAGEDSGPENVWEAIELLGAKRIGHGISSVRDPQLLTYLRDKQICLEVCPTSNFITQAVTSLEAHPLKSMIKAEVPVCINTDDPGVFGNTLPGEFKICINNIGLSSNELEFCKRSANLATFIN